MDWIAILTKISMSFIFSLLIGINREKRDSPAGIRTHVIVGISATFMAILQNLFMQDYGVRETRLLAAVITGVGFLGAGAISSNKLYVKGLASAATVWTVAVLGLVTGSGYYGLAIVAFGMIYFTLTILKRLIYPLKELRVELHFTDFAAGYNAINEIFEQNKITSTVIASKATNVDGVLQFSAVYLVRIHSDASVRMVFQEFFTNPFIHDVEMHAL